MLGFDILKNDYFESHIYYSFGTYVNVLATNNFILKILLKLIVDTNGLVRQIFVKI